MSKTEDKKRHGFAKMVLHWLVQKMIEHGSLYKPVHTSATYGYNDARQLAEVFQGRAQGYLYGRQGNPTVSALEDKVNLMEGDYATICFATGMAAIVALIQGLYYAPATMLYRAHFYSVIQQVYGKLFGGKALMFG